LVLQHGGFILDDYLEVMESIANLASKLDRIRIHGYQEGDATPIEDEENIRRIAKDCSSPIYEINYINFSSSISREMMTLFAQLCVEYGCSQRISRVGVNIMNHR